MRMGRGTLEVHRYGTAVGRAGRGNGMQDLANPRESQLPVRTEGIGSARLLSRMVSARRFNAVHAPS